MRVRLRTDGYAKSCGIGKFCPLPLRVSSRGLGVNWDGSLTTESEGGPAKEPGMSNDKCSRSKVESETFWHTGYLPSQGAGIKPQRQKLRWIKAN